MRSPDQVQLCTAAQEVLPGCAEVRATWPDGSIKWILLDAQATVEAATDTAFTIRYGADVAAPTCTTPLKATMRADCLDISTGALALRVNRSGKRLFQSISQGQREFLPPQEEGEFTAADAAGKTYTSQVEEALVEEENPLRLVVKATGGLVAADGARLLSWLVRIYFYAHQAFFKLYHTFVHDQPAAFVHLAQLRFRLLLHLQEPRQAALGARTAWFGHGLDFAPLDHPVSLVQWNVERFTVLAAERSDFRTNAHGWVHVADEGAGITVKLRRPWQNYPKAFSTDGTSVSVDLYPDLQHLQAPADEPGRRWTEIDQVGNVEFNRPLRLPQGMAKTHELFLHFGPPCPDARAVDYLALSFEQPLLLTLPSGYYARTRALGAFPPLKDEYWPLELKLRRFCQPPNGAGMINCGDQVRLGRQNNEVRTLTTENLAYELPRSLLRQYLRSQDQSLFWEGEAAIMHLMDVDTVHFHTAHPEWVGGPYLEWSQNHHYATTDEDEVSGPRISHTWLGSLLDYYFLTGYQRAREVAEACADYCRRVAPYNWKQSLTPEARDRALDPDQSWEYSSRVVGWPLTAMGTYFAAFRSERFLRAMEALVDLLEVWQDEEGRWREQIGSFNRGATPFMNASVLQGLQQYYESSGDERARRMLLQGARFLAREGRTVEGTFYYKESPVSDRPHTSTAMLLGPLAFAYEATKDPLILDAGYRIFRWVIDSDQVSTYMLKDLFAFMPLLDRLGLLEDYRGLDIEAHLNHPDSGRKP